jgi:hypothetical protein
MTGLVMRIQDYHRVIHRDACQADLIGHESDSTEVDHARSLPD